MDTPVLLETERRITDSGLAKVSSGLLPVGTLLLSSRAPIGYLAIAEIPVAVNQGFIAMKPKNGVSNLFLLNLVRHRMEDIKSHANGSTFMEISKSAFRPIQVVAPPTPLLQAFDVIARSLYDRLVLNQRQIATLTELRDTLLPRLMSGKLRIP
jgi:type I restriction enzyme S subunit